jgi:hypothetical protein
VPASATLEALDVVEYIHSRVILVPWTSRAVRSVFGDEKKFSIAALSRTSPDRLIKQLMP